jgi:hypothetical protein
MKKLMKAGPVGFLLAAISLGMVQPAAAGEPRAVIELFTSQGCSSCPPADKLLGELARDPTLIALSLPVDYWDYLGWKDTLALRGHAVRQRAYAQTRGDRAVYTPQVVVNGVVHALGSDKAAIQKAIADSRTEANPLTVPVSLKVQDGKVTVTLPETDKVEGLAQIWLCPLTDQIPVKIERGENGGHDLTYYDVVRRWVKLAQWSGKAETFSMTIEDVLKGIGGDVDRIAVLVQKQPDGKPGLMLGAAEAKLK